MVMRHFLRATLSVFSHCPLFGTLPYDFSTVHLTLTPDNLADDVLTKNVVIHDNVMRVKLCRDDFFHEDIEVIQLHDLFH